MLDRSDGLTASGSPEAAAPDDRARFVRVLRAHLPALGADQELDPDRPLRDLGLTSLRAVDLLIDVEDELGVAFPDTELTDENFATADALWRVVARLLAGDAGVA